MAILPKHAKITAVNSEKELSAYGRSIAKLLSTHETCETYETLQYCHPFWSTQKRSSIDPCSSHDCFTWNISCPSMLHFHFVSRQATHHRCSPVGVDGSPKSVPTLNAQTPRPASTKAGCLHDALDAFGFNAIQMSFNDYRSNTGSMIERTVTLALLQTYLLGWILGHSCKPQSATLSTIRYWME